MKQEFNPNKYRSFSLKKDVPDSTRERQEGRGDLPIFIHKPVQFARWSEQYHYKKLLKNGNYTKGNHGEIFEEKSGMSTRELADVAKLMDYFQYDIDSVLKILPKLHLSPDQLKRDDIRDGAKRLFWLEKNHRKGIHAQHAGAINTFVKIFALEDDLKMVISEMLDYAIETTNRKYAEKLLNAFPVFEPAEIKKRLEAQYYPIPEGLKRHVQAQELFGDALEGPDEEISLDKIADILREKAELLANDLKKEPSLYWELKSYITQDDRQTGYDLGRWFLIRDDKLYQGNDKRNYCRVLFFLGDNPETVKDLDLKHKAYESARLEFHFSCSEEDAEKESGKWPKDFTTTKIFKFEGLYVGNKRLDEYGPGVQNGRFVRIDDKQPNFSALTTLKAKKTALKELMETLLAPERDFQSSLNALKELGKRHGLPTEEIENLSRAVQEFGTYMYRTNKSHVGECLIVPRNFRSFCSRKFGVHLETARYGEYHPEWEFIGSNYATYTFYHEVVVYAKRIVFDWTVTQYAKSADKPIPYIYEVGTERKEMGPLYKSFLLKTPNEQFINNPNDPLFINEPPVKYGDIS